MHLRQRLVHTGGWCTTFGCCVQPCQSHVLLQCSSTGCAMMPGRTFSKRVVQKVHAVWRCLPCLGARHLFILHKSYRAPLGSSFAHAANNSTKQKSPREFMRGTHRCPLVLPTVARRSGVMLMVRRNHPTKTESNVRFLSHVSLARLRSHSSGSFASTSSDMQQGAWAKLTVAQLKQLLRERGLKVSGKKAELIARLEHSSETQTQAGKEANKKASVDVKQQFNPLLSPLGLVTTKRAAPSQNKGFKLVVILAEKRSAAQDIVHALDCMRFSKGSDHKGLGKGFISSAPIEFNTRGVPRLNKDSSSPMAVRPEGNGAASSQLTSLWDTAAGSAGISMVGKKEKTAQETAQGELPVVTVVTWAQGHLLEFPESAGRWSLSKLPVIPEHFDLVHTKNPMQRKQFEIVKKLMANADELVNACDAGREGELIFRFLCAKIGAEAPVKRLWVSSLTEEALRQGLRDLQPGERYDTLFLSALARKQADWIVGVNATQAHTLTLKKKWKERQVLSLGRVQTPVLRALVDRYNAHNSFVGQTNWSVILKCRGAAEKDSHNRVLQPEHQTEISLRYASSIDPLQFPLVRLDFSPPSSSPPSVLASSFPSGESAAAFSRASFTSKRARERELQSQLKFIQSLKKSQVCDQLEKWGVPYEASDRSDVLRDALKSLLVSPQTTYMAEGGAFRAKALAQMVASDVKDTECIVQSKEDRKQTEPPPLLYNLTSLQKEASRLHGFSATRTLAALQALYEKHKMVSYPRTDSRYITPDLLPHIDKVLLTLSCGGPWLPPEVSSMLDYSKLSISNDRVFTSSTAQVRDHHAIIPTPEGLQRMEAGLLHLPADQVAVYHMVLRRLVGVNCGPVTLKITASSAAFMPECKKTHTEVVVSNSGHLFKAKGTSVDQPGWRVVYHNVVHQTQQTAATAGTLTGRAPGSSSNKKSLTAAYPPKSYQVASPPGYNTSQGALLSRLRPGDKLDSVLPAWVKQEDPRPPPLYTEASLLTMMEKAGCYTPESAKRIKKGKSGKNSMQTTKGPRDHRSSTTELQQPSSPLHGGCLHSNSKGTFAMVEESEHEEPLSIVDPLLDLSGSFSNTGLGTPATRAAILERLIEVGYVERRGMQLVPTEKGQRLIQLIRTSPIASAEMTAEWEQRLHRVAVGEDSAESFIEDIKNFTRQFVEQVKTEYPNKAKEKPKANPFIKRQTLDQMGWCWKCKQGQMVTKEHWKIWRCSETSNGGCDFRVFKTIAGKLLTQEQLRELLKEGKTKLLRGFISKAGKPFSARLVLSDKGAVLDFPKKKKTKASQL